MFIVIFFCKGAFIIKYVHFMLYAAESICKGSEEKITTYIYCILYQGHFFKFKIF